MYMILLLVFIALNFFFGDRHEPKVKTPIIEQIRSVSKNEKLWLFSLFYFITFGSFVAFTIYLPNFLVSNFGLEKVDAGMRTAGFIAVATFFRPIGGWLADKFQPLFLLIGTFSIYTVAAIILAFMPDMGLYTVGCLAIAAGIANGIVSMMGGLGGFFPPIMLSVIYSATGQYSIGFMLLSQVALASLVLVVWLYFQDRLALTSEVFNSTGQGILVTDVSGHIKTVNPAFTKLTGYTEDEVLGRQPSILKSGRQSKEFYRAMWSEVREKGMWQGEIWNKRKNGEEYLQWLNISAVKDETGEDVRYGRILVEPLTATHDVPHFTRSPYDGYAIASADSAGASGDNRISFTVVDHIGAGEVSQVTVGAFEAVRLMTGAALPAGADAVVMFEQTTAAGHTFTIRKAFAPQENLSLQGEDMRSGEMIIPPGSFIHPGTIALLATFGYGHVQVAKRPVVGILATGTELLDVTSPLAPGKIRNSNGPMIAAQLARMGIPYKMYDTAADQLEECLLTVRKAMTETDCLITTGGVSVGDYDFLPEIYKRLGADVLFNKVAMRPGSVTTVAVTGDN
ncbi:hypothetical protein KC345_g11267, partial [Hortaea werneckii]